MMNIIMEESRAKYWGDLPARTCRKIPVVGIIKEHYIVSFNLEGEHAP